MEVCLKCGAKFGHKFLDYEFKTSDGNIITVREDEDARVGSRRKFIAFVKDVSVMYSEHKFSEEALELSDLAEMLSSCRSTNDRNKSGSLAASPVRRWRAIGDEKPWLESSDKERFLKEVMKDLSSR